MTQEVPCHGRHFFRQYFVNIKKKTLKLMPIRKTVRIFLNFLSFWNQMKTFDYEKYDG
jgi:hypothetical protein